MCWMDHPNQIGFLNYNNSCTNNRKESCVHNCLICTSKCQKSKDCKIAFKAWAKRHGMDWGVAYGRYVTKLIKKNRRNK